ncbi:MULTISPECIES: sensor histidine kinase [unclassified Streptomyces]|uniref:sensor histidine kinase n=1 Tax=unclassified Streptomyces TaxID=2593676 RepID=UPI002E151EE5|nr:MULTISPECIES: histidine kinase [unclassified Streptomyces]WSR27193.1 histidine kinase [Streptomyces sp. NBC_01205]
MPRLAAVNEQSAPPATPAAQGRSPAAARATAADPTAHPGRASAPRGGWLWALGRDLINLEWDPLPKMSRPRWLNRLPHVAVGYVAVFFCFLTTEQLGDHYGVTGGPPLVAALLTGGSIVLAMFRPMAGWWLGVVAGGLGAWLIQADVSAGQTWPWTAGGLIAFAPVLLLVALRVPPRVTIAAVGVPVVLTGLAEAFLKPAHSQSTVLSALLLYGVVGLLGYALRATRLARGKLVEQETLTEEERAQRTLLEERTRIARELHDVVAHHMSVISIQAQVAPHLVENPSEELKENLAGIRENALEALTELRRVLGVLRSEQPDDPANPHHPQPTLAELDGLVDNVRSAGLEVVTEIAGVRRALAPGVDLTAYRIVQEALSNCLRHAPGSRVEVGVAYGPRELHLCIANSAPTRPAPPSQGAGHGLLGMRERAGMLGGELAAGPLASGGYEVSAVLPMDPETKKD